MAEITEAQVYDALGWRPENKPEAADPAANNAGANAQGVAAPAGAGDEGSGGRQMTAPTGDGRQIAGATEGAEDNRDGGRQIAGATAEDGGRSMSAPTGTEDEGRGRQIAGTTEGAEGTQDGGKAPMSREERAEQARLRREREKQAAVDAAKAEARKAFDDELKEMFASMGLTDRYHDNRPITNREEFEAWQAANKAAGLNRRLKAGELTAEDMQSMVEASPVMQQVRETLEEIRGREQAARQEQDKAAFEKVMAMELEQIHQMDPRVKTLEDALNLPTGQEFARLVNERGMTYLEAFQLANMEQLTKARTMAAAQGQAMRQHGKDHLRAIGIAGGPSVDIPPETMRQYHEMLPDWTDDQIRRDYVQKMGLS